MSHTITAKKIFYRDETDMRKSFPGLIELSEKEIGAKFLEGDVVVFDNIKEDRRKVLLKTKDGYTLHYMWRINPSAKFAPVGSGSKSIKID